MITATDYSPLPSQEAMNIQLYGESGSELFYYRMVMVGTADKGYKVDGMFRGNGPFPAPIKKPFTPPLSVSD